MVLDSLDDTIAVWVASHRLAQLDGLFVWLGTVNTLGAVWVALAILIGLAFRRGLGGTAVLAALTGLTVIAADGAALGVKHLVHRPRPFVAHPGIDPLTVVHSSSFPSGHATTAFAGATLLSYVAPGAAPWLVILAVAIGFSRVYVGVHYLGDVGAGALLGIGVGLGAILLVRAGRRRGLGSALALESSA